MPAATYTGGHQISSRSPESYRKLTMAELALLKTMLNMPCIMSYEKEASTKSYARLVIKMLVRGVRLMTMEGQHSYACK